MTRILGAVFQFIPFGMTVRRGTAKNAWRDYHLIAIHTLHIRGTYNKKENQSYGF
jgi:hypothetical protein